MILWNRRLSAALLLVLAAASLSACGTAAPADAGGSTAVALLIGSHACSKAPDLDSSPIREAVARAVGSYGYLSVIRVDGDPEIVLEGSCEIDDRYKGADSQKLAQDAASRTAALLAQLETVQAATPEVDTLAALRLGVRSFASVPEEWEKMIVVADSGLSTTGPCDFTNNLLNGDPDAIAQSLQDMEAIPDLSGVQVVWQQMGDVEAPQQDLSPRQTNRLKEIWSAIIEAGGGTLTIYDTPPAGGSLSQELPAVSTVPLAQEAPIAYEPSALEDATFSFDQPVFLRENQVRFVGDSDAFADEDAAIEVISPVAEYMLAHPELHLLLAGTTAGDGTTRYSLELSLSRAAAVRQVLVRLGVEAERIRTIGLGCNDPWHLHGVGTQGALAAQNRKVVLLDADSQLAQQLLSQAE